MSNDTTQELPRFKHDCDACKYLGRFREYDLYFCASRPAGISTLLARWSDKPSEYLSGCVEYVTQNTTLLEAKRRAIAAGLLPAEPSEPEKWEQAMKSLDENRLSSRPHNVCTSEPSDRITIAEVAAKLGLKRQASPRWEGLVDLSESGRAIRWFVLYPDGTGYIPSLNYSVSRMEVCELAGVDYERYEGREPEPVESEASAEEIGEAMNHSEIREWIGKLQERGDVDSLAQLARDGLDVEASLRDALKNSQDLREAGRAESAQVVAECLKALKSAEESFRHYAKLHREKGTPEGETKALVNDLSATVMRAAITQAEALGKGEG